MLTITKQQMMIFNEAQLIKFKGKMEEYFREFAYNPRGIATSDIRDFINSGISSAKQKFTTEDSLHKFLLACWLVGTDKVRASEEAMIARADRDCGELERADSLLNETLASLLE